MLSHKSQLSHRRHTQLCVASNNKCSTSHERNETYLTTKQTAAILQVSVKTLESWRRTQLQGPPYCKLGHLVRYRMSDLAAYMEDILIEPTTVDILRKSITSPKTVHLVATSMDDVNK